jgi:hypothetical protein
MKNKNLRMRMAAKNVKLTGAFGQLAWEDEAFGANGLRTVRWISFMRIENQILAGLGVSRMPSAVPGPGHCGGPNQP